MGRTVRTCARGDLNPQEISLTRPSTAQRVFERPRRHAKSSILAKLAHYVEVPTNPYRPVLRSPAPIWSLIGHGPP